ncbi:glucose-6-phosphate dehydrogenase [Amphritea sp. 2_MG-2023]|uniref:glucose-6-phosphate dehydrogenase n=1 Tax=Amphritea TaxID=515417 RepID=UPI001C07857B|nr:MULTISPECIES: glucose-6-phosphate dehydrogenase [Amphritea]MBU2964167.1 glucose-6-phosphate dehydrogenase [Amphritea atlantica]MDO6418566.1 glucose-6-phosphate dehydrogenase [Amphritea sp. 2_MG-2023]
MAMVNRSSDIVIFGAMGDLAQRKLIPALFQLESAELLGQDTRIIGLARSTQDSAAFRKICSDSLSKRVKPEELNTEVVNRFLAKIEYNIVSFTEVDSYQTLKNTLNSGAERARVFYYATPASLYGAISRNLTKSDCINTNSCVVLEKPIGHNLRSSNEVNDQVAEYFDESQIYRIDHYLGKETVQNLIALRFANPLFGSQWNQSHISHVEITVAEKVGIEGRWGYFDKAGQMRDMVQNHLLQLLCLTAMDPPDDLSADMIRNEKVKVLKALRPITAAMCNTHVVRGRYTKGMVEGNPVPGYMEEEGANPDSNTETFVSIKAEINNWRWAGVPFYLRTGKRLPEKLSQITIHFKPQPHFIFDENQRHLAQNKLIIRLQPEEGISLQILNKDHGLNQGMRLRSEALNLNFSQSFEKSRVPDAYERLLLKVIQGNQYLFVRRDEVEHAWLWCDQLMEYWKNENKAPLPYPAGTWGPKAADLMLIKDGNCWYEDQ